MSTRSAPVPFVRIALRTCLLAGAACDFLQLVDVGLSSYLRFLNGSEPIGLGLAIGATGARCAVQVLACYDLHRYRPLVPIVALSFLLPAASGLIEGMLHNRHIVWAAIGLSQLVFQRLHHR